MGIKKTLYGTADDFFKGMRLGLSCPTPGVRIRGRARGRSRGPMGVPFKEKDIRAGTRKVLRRGLGLETLRVWGIRR